jgi:hypothetical protein
MKETKHIWIGVIPDIFGYGISVASETKEGAMKALRKRWNDWMPGSSFPEGSTFDQHFEDFGGEVKQVSLDRPYFENFKE